MTTGPGDEQIADGGERGADNGSVELQWLTERVGGRPIRGRQPDSRLRSRFPPAAASSPRRPSLDVGVPVADVGTDSA
ncbi:Hypothetical protein NTJ_03950 [Nesidiocoris tenuis]|uniref:Uncharacterized protein n=1 Tax=Nesidiocoris tenuis TaxID=355587 RepID=A0ABN7AGG1_9HEMI|nr:Hypothetical protein NTJ_03950 [Nesidiocoris tenuis]